MEYCSEKETIMMPLILSVVTATFFLVLSSVIYGSDALVADAWVAMVFWGLIGTGALVSMLSRPEIQ
jgi:hypothetical protein